jgi:hypothetical protein
MTLRDYFAAMAMQGLVATHGLVAKELWDQSAPEMFARDAYELADAMLAERNKEQADA